MPRSDSTRKRLLSGFVTAAFAAALTVAVPGTASAESATPYVFKLCAYGNYKVRAELPQQGNVSTTIVLPGNCTTLRLGAATTYAKVRGSYNTSGSTFYVGTSHFTAARGSLTYALGTTANAGADAYLWYSTS
ncbi:hypothetical protein AB0E83_27570 [Streptomyces sp. NPDC035033]|uniref:hypothetical protein n=1 Tax=Streptomyces sp. NPDC035033 TaxID=3155368 RepID=UPI0033FAFBB1